MKTIDINFFISGTKITIPFNANCSITNKAFSGNIIIEYYPSKKVIEYVDMGEVIKEITKNKLTVEELADNVFKEVKIAISPKYLKILVDVQRSDAHQPVQVWIEENFE
jgi:NADPH-dependent 7-cyano-7-deazaguanine reductase QueF